MATTTPNFGWSVPTSTDLVKDGATAIETLGDSIDASLVDLKGGTTGQILSKNSNTDMDFTWAAPTTGDITGVTAGTGISGGGTSGDVTITNSMATAITTNGDLIYGTGSGTFTRQGIGTTGQILTVSGGVPSWATPASSTLSLAQVASGTISSGSELSISGLSSYDTIEFRVSNVNNTAGSQMYFRVNGSTSSVYDYDSVYDRQAGTFSAFNQGWKAETAATQFEPMNNAQAPGDANSQYRVTLTNCKASGFTLVSGSWVYRIDDGSLRRESAIWTGIFKTAAAVSSIQLGFIFSSSFTGSQTQYVVWGG
jgi:hypothetical protein